MAVVCVAVCPHPPLLIPEVAAGAAQELDDLRRACDAAVVRMLERCDEVRLVAAAGGLPSAIDVGRWLLTRNDVAKPIAVQVLGPDAPVLGVPFAGRQGLLVMADGSARRTPKAPGALHPGAEEFDRGIEELLRRGAPADLTAADDMWCTSAPAFTELRRVTEDATWDRDVLYAAAPYGVGYFVASWVRVDG